MFLINLLSYKTIHVTVALWFLDHKLTSPQKWKQNEVDDNQRGETKCSNKKMG